MGHICLSHSHPIAIYACPVPSPSMGRFSWDSHRNDILMDKPRVVHGTYLSVPSHSNLCLSHPMGRFPWESHRNPIPMDKPGISLLIKFLLFVSYIAEVFHHSMQCLRLKFSCYFQPRYYNLTSTYLNTKF